MSIPGIRLPRPPPHAQRFWSDDLDEVRALVARSDGEHSRVVHGSGPLRYARHMLLGRVVGFAWGSMALAQTLRGALGSPTLHFPLEGAGLYAFGRGTCRIGPGSAAYVAPGWEFTRRSEAGALFALSVEESALALEIDARRQGEGRGWRAPSQSFEPTASVVAAAEEAIAALAESPVAAGAAQVREHAEARVLSVVADMLQRGSALSRAAPTGSARLASLETWIDAHLGEPITMGRLCRVAGVGARSLQLGFACRRGVSPMRFVADRRLAAARRRLERPAPGDDVTSVAFATGFTHLGRFAIRYRQTFGESPSQTLRG